MKKFKNVDINLVEEKITKEDKAKIKEEKKRKRQENKELKKENKKVLKTTKDILPFIDLDEDNAFITNTGYLNIYQIETKDIYSLNDYEMDIQKYNFISFLRNYTSDFKLISMNFPVNTLKQQEYIGKKINEAKSEIVVKLLEEKFEQFSFLESHRFNREFFLMCFSKDKSDVIKNVIQNQNRAIVFKEIDIKKNLKYYLN